ncbi:MAG: hypothetical protein AAGA97_09920 [Pseudomonadota bacterium]
MLEEKRKDLDSEKQKKLLQRLVEELSHRDTDFYYRSTSEIAASLKGYIDVDAQLITEEKALLAKLTQRDIEVILSLH